MNDVVCAVRGGPGSYRLRAAALERVHGLGVPVHFLSVVDPLAYGSLHEGEQNAIRAEMAWRDLAIAKATAAHIGVPEVRFTVQVRVGPLAEMIASYAIKLGAETILIGSPRSAADATLADTGAEVFAEDLRRRTGASVVVVSATA